MLSRNILALLIAGLTVVTATNATNETTTAPATTTAAAATNATVAATTAAATTAAATSAATTTGPASSATTTAASTVTQAATTAAAQSTVTTAAATTNTTVTTAATIEASEVSAEISFVVGNMPSNATGTSLLEDTSFRSALELGICESIGKPVTDCTVYEITLTSRRRLEASHRRLADSTLGVKFTVALATGDTAASLNTVMETKATDNTFGTKLKARLEAVPVNGVTLTVDATQTIAKPVGTKPTLMNAGDWSMAFFTDSACGTAHGTRTTVTAKIAKTKDTNCGDYKAADGTTDNSINVAACKDGATVVGASHTALCSTVTAVPTFASLTGLVAGACKKQATGVYMKVTCTAAAGGGAAASDASSKSIVGVVMGLVMGLIALM